MARIPLRSYHREIENLIDRGQIEEAIAHSKNILKQYPKNIETYRLLGKAYLESQRYSEASDILQRLLSVVPDDFVSQLGMSVIREDEGNLDAAIWHMERAYEVQPFNRAVQDELRRLYGRRDGSEPPRIRLTRGSLVRMYARGDLYSQAIAESRAALAEDHQRLDLQVLLAQMYYLSGQKVEAAEIASSLIGKLPYCLDANRILMEILPNTSRAEESRIFQHRVYDLDPYAEFVTPNTPTSAQVPEQAVMVERVDWQPTMQESQSPDWARSIGVKWEEDKEENLPDWLNTFGTNPAQSTQTGITPVQKQEIIPDFMRDAGWSQSENVAEEQQPSPIDIEEIAPASAEEELEQVDIPDWLKDMAPKSASGEADQEVQRLDWLDNILPVPGSNAPAPSDQPSEILPQAEERVQAESPEPVAETPLDLSGSDRTEPEEISSPLSSILPPELKAAEPEDETPDWLKEFSAPESSLPLVEPAAKASDTQPEENVPDWLSTQAPSSQEDFSWIQAEPSEGEPISDSLPSWLREKSTDQPAAVEEVPAWLNESEVTAPVEPPEANQIEWIKDQAEIETTPAQSSIESQNDTLSAWLNELKSADAVEAGIQETAAAGPSSEEEIPSWMTELNEPEQPAEPALENQSIPAPVVGEDIPAWMPESVPEPAPPSSAEEPAQVDASAANPQDMDLDSAMAWLEALAAKQGADEASLKITAPEQRSETPPDWISDYTQPDATALADESGKVENELPAWMVGDQTSETPPSLAPAEAVVSPAEENPTLGTPPTWAPETEEIGAAETLEIPAPGTSSIEQKLDALIPPDLSEHPQEEKTQPVALRKPEETPPAPEPALDDIGAAMAWMEALAAKQGADADSLKITSLEERSETPPDWIANLSPVEPEANEVEQADQAPEMVEETAWKPEEEVPELPEAEASPVPVDDLPDWLKGLAEEGVTEGMPEPHPEPTAASTETDPDWLNAAPEPPAQVEPAPTWTPEAEASFEPLPLAEEIQPVSSPQEPSTPSDMDSALAWMEALAAKQGADAGSLKIATPEERSETPPDWIAELAKNQPPVPEAEPEAALEPPPQSMEETPQVESQAAAISEPEKPPLVQEGAETEIPDWLLNYEQEQNQKAMSWEAPEAAQPAPVQTSAADDSITLWLKRHHPETGELKTPAAAGESPIPAESPEVLSQPEPIESPLTAAHTAISQGKIPEAVELYNQMIKSGDHLEIVINDLHEALERHPEDADIWQTLGDAHIRANRIQDALDAYTKAEELLR